MIQDIAPHHYDVSYHTERTPARRSFLVLVAREGVLFRATDDGFTLPRFADFETESLPFPSLCQKARYLFAIDEDFFFLLPASALPAGKLGEGYRFLGPTELRDLSPRYLAFAAITATQLYRFYDQRKFCGRCGAPMTHSEHERAMCCKHCGLIEYPKISPAIIVAVRDGDRLLLTRYAKNASDYRRKALVAGFVEVGETPEQAVTREVMEETGLKVKNIRPYAVQPWSFSDSLMLAYTAELDGSDRIRLDENELCEASFVPRDEIPDNPTTASVGNELIQRFKRGEL